MSEPAIRARNVGIKFNIRHHDSERTLRSALVHALIPSRGGARKWNREFWALEDVSLAVQPGEVVGLIGRNGAGKSTLLRALGGIVDVDRGDIAVRGRVACMMTFGIGFNPNLTGRENIYLSASLIGIETQRIEEILEEVIEFSELGEFVAAPVRTYSKGMRVRLGFSIAIHCAPEVLLLDEVLTAGDEAFRRKAGNVIEHLRGDRQAVVIASHNMGLIRSACDRAIWLEEGHVREAGDADATCAAYLEDVSARQ